AQARRLKHMLAVMFVDLDMFKLLNDKLGHACGDQLLKDTAQHLKTLVRETDLVSRIGGDEFAVLLTQIGDSVDALKVAERINNAINYTWAFEEKLYAVTASIGISIYPKDGEDIDSLLSSADTAMYRTKKSGGNNFQFYSKR
ncbi:MAG: GGDEF domain-containing protein, partial [Candidatus Contubernalis sp.]|nr:GGDEF domain-containing protein [Candidatus Contubernalis sp.]